MSAPSQEQAMSAQQKLLFMERIRMVLCAERNLSTPGRKGYTSLANQAAVRVRSTPCSAPTGVPLAVVRPTT